MSYTTWQEDSAWTSGLAVKLVTEQVQLGSFSLGPSGRLQMEH